MSFTNFLSLSNSFLPFSTSLSLVLSLSWSFSLFTLSLSFSLQLRNIAIYILSCFLFFFLSIIWMFFNLCPFLSLSYYYFLCLSLSLFLFESCLTINSFCTFLSLLSSYSPSLFLSISLSPFSPLPPSFFALRARKQWTACFKQQCSGSHVLRSVTRCFEQKSPNFRKNAPKVAYYVDD